MTNKYKTSPEKKWFYFNTQGIEIEWVPNNTVPSALFTRIVRQLHEWIDMTVFDNERSIVDSIYSGYILVEYNSQNARDRDIEWNMSIELENAFKSKALKKGRQIVETAWYFECNRKYYLVSYVRNRKTDGIAPEKWVYKGIIVNHWAYNSSQLWEDEWIKSQVRETLWKTK